MLVKTEWNLSIRVRVRGIDSCYSALLYLRPSYNTNSLTWTIGKEKCSSKQTSVARHVQSWNQFWIKLLSRHKSGEGQRQLELQLQVTMNSTNWSKWTDFNLTQVGGNAQKWDRLTPINISSMYRISWNGYGLFPAYYSLNGWPQTRL